MNKLKLKSLSMFPGEYFDYGAPAFLVDSDIDDQMRAKVVEYLKKGEVIFSMLEMLECNFGCPSGDPVIYNRKFTDGVWVWPHNMQHYVEAHGMGIPHEFLKHMADQEFKIQLSETTTEVIQEGNRDFNRFNELVELDDQEWKAWLRENGEAKFLAGVKAGLSLEKSNRKGKDFKLEDLL